MEQTIIWGMVLMLSVFGIGLISAVKSRKVHKSAPRRQGYLVREVAEDSTGNKTSQASMAASGVPNGDERLASIGSSTR